MRSSAKGRFSLRMWCSSSRSGKSMKIWGCRGGGGVGGNSRVGGFVFSGAHQADMRVGFDLDAGDDGFHVAPVIQQRGEAGPALFAHPIALVDDGDAAFDHGGDEGR